MRHVELVCVVFFISFFSIHIHAQTVEDVNLQKYWFYRWRLQNDFLKVGEGAGHSIPIQSRKGIRWVQDIEVADATIYHGFYLGILATEYKLLATNNKIHDLERTKTELYYAIQAFERLDKFGESMFGYEGVINGYVARDDIPCDFINPEVNRRNYNHFNQQKTTAPGLESVSIIQTSDACFDGVPLDQLDLSIPKVAPEMSQDQVLWLLMGFMLMEKSIPSGIDSVTLHNGQRIAYDFVEQAKRHSTNMINYCKYNYPLKPHKKNWRVMRPDGKKVFPGQNVFAFKYPLSVIGNKMHTENAENPQEFKRYPGKFQWGLTKVWIPYKSVNGQMITILAAMSGKWKKTIEKTGDKIDKTWRDYNWANFYLPLMSYLHDFDISKYEVLPLVAEDLTQAPACGPYNLSNRDIMVEFANYYGIPEYTTGWARHLKYSSNPSYQQDGSLDDYTYRGFYAGLDYMLLFNLYYLTADKELPLYQNLADRSIDSTQFSVSRESNPIRSFHSINIIDAPNLNQILHLETGYVVTGAGVDTKVRQRMIEVNYELFNPWKKENVHSNSYGWNEVFPRKTHLMAK